MATKKCPFGHDKCELLDLCPAAHAEHREDSIIIVSIGGLTIIGSALPFEGIYGDLSRGRPPAPWAETDEKGFAGRGNRLLETDADDGPSPEQQEAWADPEGYAQKLGQLETKLSGKAADPKRRPPPH